MMHLSTRPPLRLGLALLVLLSSLAALTLGLLSQHHPTRAAASSVSYTVKDYPQELLSTRGTAYVGSDDHIVYALNASNGLIRWRGQTGDSVFSSPAVVNGIVYVGSDDFNVYALKASTGSKVWSFTTGGFVESSPAVANGLVYVGSFDHYVYALFATTGMLHWRFLTGNQVLSSPAVGTSQGS